MLQGRRPLILKIGSSQLVDVVMMSRPRPRSRTRDGDLPSRSLKKMTRFLCRQQQAGTQIESFFALMKRSRREKGAKTAKR